MAAYTDTVSIPALTWTEITNSDTTYITFQNLGSYPIFVAVSTSAAPSNTDGAVVYNPNEGERNIEVMELAPGTTGGDRVWVYCTKASRVYVSHD
jgi:hypothetical protein